MSTPALSPIPITSRPVRARLDQVKADLSRAYQATLGRDATWNEVMIRLLDLHDQELANAANASAGDAAAIIAALRAELGEGKHDDHDHG